MKLQLVLVFLMASAACLAARLDNTYLPPGSANRGGVSGLQAPTFFSSSNGGSGGPGSFVPGSAGLPGFSRPVLGGPGGPLGQRGSEIGAGFSGRGNGGSFNPSGGPQIPIVSFDAQNGGDGNYQYSYETGNGIQVQEQGQTQGNTEAVSGSYSYTGPDGQVYSISYTADESGFHAQGAHIPTPPPIPPEIQRGIQEALAAEARGENQDGSYKGEGGNGGNGFQQGRYQGGSNSYSASQGYKY